MNRMRDRILRTTIELFVREGIKKTTMDAVAENAKVSKVTVYKYFVDRDTLYLEIIRQVSSDYAGRLDGVLSSDDDLIRKLYAFMDVVCDLIDTGRDEMCKELAEYGGAASEAYDQIAGSYQSALMTLIDGGLQAGLFRPNLDRDMIFHSIDMGIAYYRCDGAYRDRMRSDARFRDRFMAMQIGNLFHDDARALLMG